MQRLDREVCISLHSRANFLISAIWLVHTLFQSQNCLLRIMTPPLLRVVGRPSLIPKPPDNSPTPTQQGLYKSTNPIKFQKEEKEDRNNKD